MISHSAGVAETAIYVGDGARGRGVDVGALFVRRVQRPSTPVAVAIGRRAVVVSPGLVEATYCGGVTGAGAAAALAAG